MNELLNITPSTASATATMSTVEIAEITGKKHQHVMRDTRAMLDGLSNNGPSSFEGSYLNSQNKAQPCYLLPKRECLILVSGYSVELRAKIIDRWMELEQVAKPAMLDFSDPRLLLGVVNHLQAQVGEKDEIIAEQGARLQKLDRIEGALGSMCITDAAKTLKTAPQALFRFMSSRGWIYKRAGNSAWIGRQEKINVGYLEHREHIYHDRDGYERVATNVLVTGKGLVRLSEMMAELVH